MASILVPILAILRSLLSLYTLILMGRIVFDLIQAFARDWRPKGVVLIIANLVYSLTEPPLRFLRSRFPVLYTGGGLGIDLSFIALYFLISLIQFLLETAMRSLV